MKKNINIAVVGLGQIGIYLLNELNTKRKDIELKTGKKIKVTAISARNINKKRRFKINKKIFYKNPLAILKDTKIDILFEAIGLSDGMSKRIVEESLKKKIHVITPNKALMAKHGDYLAKLAENNKVNLEFEASVAGGIPILRTIKEGLATNKIHKVFGILNGTCNYILSEMENSKDSFTNVLKRAQKLGYAEPSNPKFDLNGHDALAKVRILSSLSFNTKISHKKCLLEGIENIELKDIEITNQLNFRIKLLGITELINNQLFERVHPCLVNANSYIGNIDGVLNATIINSLPVGQSIMQGKGAGPGPTTSSLMSDLYSLLRENIKYPFITSYKLRKKISHFNYLNYSYSCYLRFEVKDKPGVLSSITKYLALNKISVRRLLQIPDKKKRSASIIIITHRTSEKRITACLRKLKNKEYLIKSPTFIRVGEINDN